MSNTNANDAKKKNNRDIRRPPQQIQFLSSGGRQVVDGLYNATADCDYLSSSEKNVEITLQNVN